MEFIRKVREQERWQQLQFKAPDPTIPHHPPIYGGAPSNIYPETLNKVGNLQVPAFTTKVDLTRAKRRAFKRGLLFSVLNFINQVIYLSLLPSTERSFENLLSDEQVQLLSQMIQARTQMQHQNKYQHVSDLDGEGSIEPGTPLSPSSDQSDELFQTHTHPTPSPNTEMPDIPTPRRLSSSRRGRTLSLSASADYYPIPNTSGVKDNDGLFLERRRENYNFPPPPPPPPSPVNSHAHRNKRLNLRIHHQNIMRKNSNSPNRPIDIEEILIDCKPDSFEFLPNQSETHHATSAAKTIVTPIHTSTSTPLEALLRQERSDDNDGIEILNSPPKKIKTFGGPPSNIYTPPEKIGNLQVPAFTTKIDYSVIELKKT